MLKFLKKLGKDRRGNAIILTAAALPLVVGSAGLANDTIQWALWKRQLQRAADSAAIAGAYARYTTTDRDTAVNADLTKNNFVKIALLSGYPVITSPANTSTWSNQVQVELALRKSLSFSAMFMPTAPMITATAKAAAVDDGSYCVVSLEASTDPGITIQGSANVNLGCGAISDSIAVVDAVDINGNAYNFASTVVAAVGGLPNTIRGTTNLQPYHLPMADPFLGLDTSVPSGMPCNGFNSFKGTVRGDGKTNITAGCYTSFDKNGDYFLNPGTYYLNSTDLERMGNGSLTGTDVTIVLTGSSPGSIKFNGNSNINLQAPTTGTFAKILFAQAANASVDNANTINGNNTSTLDGALYFPRGKVNFTGSSSNLTKCLMVVSKKVDFSGNANVQNDVVGCYANNQVTGKKVRLVA